MLGIVLAIISVVFGGIGATNIILTWIVKIKKKKKSDDIHIIVTIKRQGIKNATTLPDCDRSDCISGSITDK